VKGRKAVGESLRDRSLRSVCSFPQVPRFVREEVNNAKMNRTMSYHSKVNIMQIIVNALSVASKRSTHNDCLLTHVVKDVLNGQRQNIRYIIVWHFANH
jgi:hypothetical protein